MSNSYNNTNSVSNPDIQSLAGSSSGGANSWRIRGFSTINGSRGNGWSTNAPIGTQGAQFTGSTFGYYKIKVSFDVYATADAEANLQVQYSTDGSHWFNANIASAASGVIATNTSSASTVNGTYIQVGQRLEQPGHGGFERPLWRGQRRQLRHPYSQCFHGNGLCGHDRGHLQQHLRKLDAGQCGDPGPDH